MTTASPNETSRIVSSLKRVMKARGMTYAQLARKIGLSEPSIKRILSRATLTVQRLEQICVALEVSIHEVARLAGELGAEAADQLTLEQETALAADLKLLACFYLLANGRPTREIMNELSADEKQMRRWLVRLHSLRLVELRGDMRVRVRTTSAVAWRKDGPVRKVYEKRAREEFLHSTFAGAHEVQMFRSAELSEASWAVFLRKLEKLAGEFRDLAEIDRSLAARDKRSVAVLFAGRPWVFSAFRSLQQMPVSRAPD